MKQLKVNQIADAAALAATTSYPFTADYNQVVSASAIWTATTAAFAVALQHSLDGTTWTDFAAATAIADANGNVKWDVVGTKDALYWRVVYTRTSGTLTTAKAFLAYLPR